MPKWAAQHRSHASTRQSAGWSGVDRILRLAQAPGYVVNVRRDPRGFRRLKTAVGQPHTLPQSTLP
eukprot:1797913-Prymnesium_polylepis.1